MNSFGFITLVTLSAVLSCSAYYYRSYSPITLCMKSDYSWCTNVTYPTSCVNMDTVVMNGTGYGTSYPSAFKTIESVIVVDIDSSEDKCIILYDTYNCQGQSLVLNGSKHPSANLERFGFSNRAESYRQCSDRSLTYLRDN
ncbi:ACYPI38480 protein [Aphis craccivora]|uniref:ACYPI38480 protein n=1 Tax=Aphis craccivora TaxID=307492 RepID=A0A6G0W2E7_APHCR|nr:ACYPI38480 protein [Aphis craccivora]KAF0732698.1 ACYPI38480 protein [Aphis craccivora]KAF0732755.1 ACYPI38480 protein [Aphis craccivora]